jgi:hypothetical protein
MASRHEGEPRTDRLPMLLLKIACLMGCMILVLTTPAYSQSTRIPKVKLDLNVDGFDSASVRQIARALAGIGTVEVQSPLRSNVQRLSTERLRAHFPLDNTLQMVLTNELYTGSIIKKQGRSGQGGIGHTSLPLASYLHSRSEIDSVWKLGFSGPPTTTKGARPAATLLGAENTTATTSILASSIDLSVASSIALQIPENPSTEFIEGYNYLKAIGLARMESHSVVASIPAINPGWLDYEAFEEAQLNRIEEIARDAFEMDSSVPTMMVVADQGWPSESAKRSSIKWFYVVLNTLAAEWGIPWEQADSSIVFEEAGVYSEHARQIELAIMPLRESSSMYDRQMFEVSYFPLSRVFGSEQFLRDVLTMARLIEDKSSWVNKRYSRCRNLIQRKHFIACARKVRHVDNMALVKKGVDKTLDAMPVTLGQSTAGFNVEMELLNALLLILGDFSVVNGRFPVLNTSWTMPGTGANRIAFRSSTLPIIAAAGNDALDLSKADNVELINTAQSRENAVIVGSSNQMGEPACRSSFFPPGSGKATKFVTYSGDLGSGEGCATSFAAPRIAALMAINSFLAQIYGGGCESIEQESLKSLLNNRIKGKYLLDTNQLLGAMEALRNKRRLARCAE